MSDSLGDAVEAATKAYVMATTNGCCDHWPAPCRDCDCFRDENPDARAEHERGLIRYVLAAATPHLISYIQQGSVIDAPRQPAPLRCTACFAGAVCRLAWGHDGQHDSDPDGTADRQVRWPDGAR